MVQIYQNPIAVNAANVANQHNPEFAAYNSIMAGFHDAAISDALNKIESQDKYNDLIGGLKRVQLQRNWAKGDQKDQWLRNMRTMLAPQGFNNVKNEQDVYDVLKYINDNNGRSSLSASQNHFSDEMMPNSSQGFTLPATNGQSSTGFSLPNSQSSMPVYEDKLRLATLPQETQDYINNEIRRIQTEGKDRRDRQWENDQYANLENFVRGKVGSYVPRDLSSQSTRSWSTAAPNLTTFLRTVGKIGSLGTTSTSKEIKEIANNYGGYIPDNNLNVGWFDRISMLGDLNRQLDVVKAAAKQINGQVITKNDPIFLDLVQKYDLQNLLEANGLNIQNTFLVKSGTGKLYGFNFGPADETGNHTVQKFEIAVGNNGPFLR